MKDLNTPEIPTLARYLDTYRAVVKWKVEGLRREEAARPMVPSGTSLLGVVKHMAFVERWWFAAVLAQGDPEFPWSDDDPDADWRIGDDEDVASVIALYDAECERSREILAGFDDPDTTVPFRDEGMLSIRRVLVHMVEETARHAGHMDIMRELIDGTVGGFPPTGPPWDQRE